MRVEGGPVILKSIVLHNSELETKVQFTIINEDKEVGNWISVNLIDDAGNIFDRGTSGEGYNSVPDSSGKFIIKQIILLHHFQLLYLQDRKFLQN